MSHAVDHAVASPAKTKRTKSAKNEAPKATAPAKDEVPKATAPAKDEAPKEAKITKKRHISAAVSDDNKSDGSSGSDDTSPNKKQKTDGDASAEKPKRKSPKATAAPKKKPTDRDLEEINRLVGENYSKRISAWDVQKFEPLRNAYLTDYNIDEKGDSKKWHHGKILKAVAESKGIPIKGFVAANKRKTDYVESLPNGEKRIDEGGDQKVVYIGNKYQFTSNEQSPYAVTREDKTAAKDQWEKAIIAKNLEKQLQRKEAAKKKAAEKKAKKLQDAAATQAQQPAPVPIAVQ